MSEERTLSAYRRTDLIQAWADREQVRLATAIGLLLVLGCVAVYALGELRLPELPAFIPVADTSLVVTDIVTATLVFTFAAAFRSRGLLPLGAGYVFCAVMTAVHLLTFPGAFAPHGLIGGGISTTAWIAGFWRAGFPLAIGAYVLLISTGQIRARNPYIAIVLSVVGACAAAGALSLLAIRGEHLLPTLSINAHEWYYPHILALNCTLIAITLCPIALLSMRPRRSRLEVWLLLTLVGWLVHLVGILASPGRFTLGWYFAYVTGIFSHGVVILAMIGESGKAYSRLAMSVLTIERERETRLMTMDAVASAIAHEVKQPLAAISLHTSTARSLAERAPVDVDAIARALKEIEDCIQQTYDTVHSVQSLMGKQSRERAIISLNDLTREAVSLLRSELTGQRIQVDFDLEDQLPLVHADRVQIQQVIINLLNNAMDAMHDIRRGLRRIEISSTSVENGNVLLEVRDTGSGIPSDHLELIFDPFFTTKDTGTGLGLSLCHSIAREHGGQLWASQGEKRGAVFHLQLPAVAA